MRESIDLYWLLKHHDWSTEMNDIAKSGGKIDVDISVRIPANTPMIDWALAMTAMSSALGGTWSYRSHPNAPRGRYEIEIPEEVE